MSLEAIIISLIAASPGLIALIGQLRKDAAAAHKTGTEREQLENEITEKVLTRADTEIVKLNQRISALESDLSRERIARQALEVDLETERRARHDLETRFRKLDSEHTEYRVGIGLLLGQLVKENIPPTWKPRDTGPMGKLPEIKA